MADVQSKPYKPDAKMCCEACVFGRGPHAWWCWLCRSCGKRVSLLENPEFPGAHQCGEPRVFFGASQSMRP